MFSVELSSLRKTLEVMKDFSFIINGPHTSMLTACDSIDNLPYTPKITSEILCLTLLNTTQTDLKNGDRNEFDGPWCNGSNQVVVQACEKASIHPSCTQITIATLTKTGTYFIHL